MSDLLKLIDDTIQLNSKFENIEYPFCAVCLFEIFLFLIKFSKQIQRIFINMKKLQK